MTIVYTQILILLKCAQVDYYFKLSPVMACVWISFYLESIHITVGFKVSSIHGTST
jgi:hypothetical protein